MNLHLRNKMTLCAAITGLLGAATVLTAPQAVATGGTGVTAAARAHRHAESVTSTVGTTTPLGRLGPLTGLVIERIRVSDDVAAAKFGTDSPIEDPVREEQVLEQVREQAEAAGVDPESATAFFRDQITASKVVQRGLFARWTAHPEEAPTTRPDLGQIRQQLDRLTTALLQELKDTEHVRDEPIACTVQLALASGSGAALERLDTLHRQALGSAMRSVCRSGESTGQRGTSSSR